MSTLDYVDHRTDPGAWADALGVSREAVDLWLDAHVVDLHVDMMVPIRVLGYDPSKRHGPWKRSVPGMGHTDFPRLREASFTGLCYDIATNVVRPERNRFHATLRNIERSLADIGRHPDELAVVHTRTEYDAAVAAGRTAFFLTLQGGNALAHDPSVLETELGWEIHRITLVHLSSSVLGGSCSPSQTDEGITHRGRAFVELCNASRVLVDLAHAGKETFWGALEAHAHDVPPIVSHTGMDAVRPHWRNIDDVQLRAIADRGGVAGIMYQGNFLADVPMGFGATRADVLTHMEHVIDVAGEDAVALGTDYDGMIMPPRDLVDITHHPLLVQDMLQRGWTETRIRKALGENYLRVVGDVRP